MVFLLQGSRAQGSKSPFPHHTVNEDLERVILSAQPVRAQPTAYVTPISDIVTLTFSAYHVCRAISPRRAGHDSMCASPRPFISALKSKTKTNGERLDAQAAALLHVNANLRLAGAVQRAWRGTSAWSVPGLNSGHLLLRGGDFTCGKTASISGERFAGASSSHFIPHSV